MRHLMSRNFSAPRSAPKPALGHGIIAQFQRHTRGDDAVAAVRDVGERPAVDEGRRVVFKALHEIGLERVFQERGHRALCLQVARRDGHIRARIGDDDFRETRFQVFEIVREA